MAEEKKPKAEKPAKAQKPAAEGAAAKEQKKAAKAAEKPVAKEKPAKVAAVDARLYAAHEEALRRGRARGAHQAVRL